MAAATDPHRALNTTLSGLGVDPETVLLAQAADLGPQRRFSPYWVVITSQSVWHGTPENGLVEVPVATIDDARCDGLVGTGLLVVTVEGEDRLICQYTHRLAQEFAQVAAQIKGLAAGEPSQDPLAAAERPSHCPECGLRYPDRNRGICPHCLDRRSLFMRTLAFLPRYRGQIGLIIVLMLAGTALQLVPPYLSGPILFDEVLHPDGAYRGYLVAVVGLIALTQGLGVLFHILHARINSELTAQVFCDVKTDIFHAMQRLSMRFFTSKQTGGLMTRVNSDAQHLQYFFHDGLPYLVVNGLQIVGIMGIMIWLDWQLALLVLVPAPLLIYATYVAFPHLWRLFTRRFRTTQGLNAVVNDSLTGVRVVKAFGREETEKERFGQRNADLFDASVRAGHYVATLFPLMGLLMGMGTLVVWGYGGWQVLQGQLSLGTLIGFTLYIGMLYRPLQWLTQIVEWWSSCMNAAQRIFEIMDAEPELAEAPEPVQLPQLRGAVAVKGVHFAYERNKPVLKDISFAAEPGEMIGLVGHSGAGKSTLTNLISRLYDVDRGVITIDGVDVRQLAVRDLRRQLGIVPQEVFLFEGTVLENIGYARPAASPVEIMQAARIANAHDFIMQLPHGYETMLGSRGQDLSGGERQRIAIARAVLHNPRILILDEATSSVDTETESRIQEALQRLTSGRTTFAIAHRLSTLRRADRLVVLEKGRVVEAGTHQELVRKEGVYFKLLQRQREALKIGVKIQ